mmetsp:Transcript_26006/g.66028  ORF Transcript_26006/g.66028 Transcript_26006/m.66028 type:complete len:645 (-) Transcript_26006:1612-3546(-)
MGGVVIEKEPSSPSKPLSKLVNGVEEVHVHSGGIPVTFKDVRHTVQIKGNKSCIKSRRRPAREVEILHGVSGEARPGEILAIMGPSGAGKTTLLNLLSARAKATAGDIRLNGKNIVEMRNLKRKIGFVNQSDLLFSNLTVRETISFSAQLRLPQRMPHEEKERRVDEIIQDLGLSKVANSKIGMEGRRGVSGGEMKRVSIAVEMVTDPQVLFLDEPTTGLDSSTALSLVLSLVKLAKAGKTIICTIHQPRSNIFSLFDRLLLLQHGKTVYFGGSGESVDYFSSLGHPVPPMTNPADHFMDALTSSHPFREFHLDEEKLTYSSLALAKLKMEVEKEREEEKWVTSSFHQFKVLIRRSFKQGSGETVTSINAITTLLVLIAAGSVWFQFALTVDRAQDRVGALFFLLLQQSSNALNAVARLFPPEKHIVTRERATGSYRLLPYFLAKTIGDFMNTIAFPFVYYVLMYWIIGLYPDFGRFVTFLVIGLSCIIAGQSLGLLASAAGGSAVISVILTPTILMFLLLFGGFYSKLENISPAVSWIKFISFLSYGFEASVLNQFDIPDLVFSCTNITSENAVCPLTGMQIAQRVLGNASTPGVLRIPNSALSSPYGSGMGIWGNILCLWVMIIVLRIGTYFALRRITKLRV